MWDEVCRGKPNEWQRACSVGPVQCLQWQPSAICLQDAYVGPTCACYLGKSLTFRRSFSVFHCLPALSISRAEEAITKTIPRDRRQLIKLMLRKSTFLPPRSHLIGQFIKRQLVTIRRKQHVLAQWLRQYFVKTTAYAVRVPSDL